jgi:hypothetical protein
VGSGAFELSAIATAAPQAAWLIEAIPSTQSEVALTIGLEAAVVVWVTWIFVRRPASMPRRYAFVALLGVFVGHSAIHLLHASYFSGYTRLDHAATITPLAGVIICRHLCSTRRQFVAPSLRPR